MIPGQIDHAELASSLRNQGLGGPLVVTATLFIGSDPHRTLFVENLNLSLEFASGLQVVSGENPRLIPSLSIPPSAGFFAATFAWTMNSSKVGDYRLALNVSSGTSGSAEANTTVSIRVGPVLGKPTLQPGSPTTTTPLTFALPAATGFDDPNVTLNVTLYVFQTTQRITPVSATNGTLRLGNADRSWTFVRGTPLVMEEQGGGNFVRSVGATARGTLIYWVYAEASLPNGTVIGASTTAPTRVFIEDPGVTAAVYWGGLGSVTAILAVVLYALFYDPLAKKPAVGALHNSPDRIRVSLALLAVGATVLVVAIFSGAAVGLWRWFGYL